MEIVFVVWNTQNNASELQDYQHLPFEAEAKPAGKYDTICFDERHLPICKGAPINTLLHSETQAQHPGLCISVPLFLVLLLLLGRL